MRGLWFCWRLFCARRPSWSVGRSFRGMQWVNGGWLYCIATNVEFFCSECTPSTPRPVSTHCKCGGGLRLPSHNRRLRVARRCSTTSRCGGGTTAAVAFRKSPAEESELGWSVLGRWRKDQDRSRVHRLRRALACSFLLSPLCLRPKRPKRHVSGLVACVAFVAP